MSHVVKSAKGLLAGFRLNRSSLIGNALRLGGVDEFEQVSGGCDLDRAKEALGELVVTGGDGSVDLQVPEHAFDAVAFLVKDAVVDDRRLAVRAARDDGVDPASAQVVADGIGVVSFVAQQGGRFDFGKRNQRVVRLAVSGLTACQMEGERSPAGIGDTVNLTAEPAPRAAKSLSMSPPFTPAADTWARMMVLSML